MFSDDVSQRLWKRPMVDSLGNPVIQELPGDDRDHEMS